MPATRTAALRVPGSPGKERSHRCGDRKSARVFWSGRSQAVRLPKEFRFDSHAVSIWREGNRVVLEPLEVPVDERGWPIGFWDVFGALPDDFDLGDRERPAERPAPLGRGRRHP